MFAYSNLFTDRIDTVKKYSGMTNRKSFAVGAFKMNNFPKSYNFDYIEKKCENSAGTFPLTGNCGV
jgi:hypothetical protein